MAQALSFTSRIPAKSADEGVFIHMRWPEHAESCFALLCDSSCDCLSFVLRRLYQARLDAVRTALLSPMPEAMHALPYSRYTTTDRAAFLMRCVEIPQ